MKAFGCNAGNRQKFLNRRKAVAFQSVRRFFHVLPEVFDENLRSSQKFASIRWIPLCLEGPSFLTARSPVPVRFSLQYDQYESTVMRFVKDFLLDRAGLNNVMLHMLFVQAPCGKAANQKKPGQ